VRPILVASIDLDKIEERSQIGPRRRNDLPHGPAVLAVLAPARVERLLRVEATISVDTEIVEQALRQIGRATSRDAAVVIAERRRAAQATASRHQERLSPPSLSDRWCVQRGDLRRNARHRARRLPIADRRAGTRGSTQSCRSPRAWRPSP